MGVTDREQEIIDLLRREPLITPAAIAERLGSSRAAVNVHLSNLGRKGVILGRGYILSERPPVVVVGGANLDIKARSSAAAIAHTSNPGHTSTTPGGVARNIAENLARLGTPTQLIAAVGRDPYGERLLADTRAAGVLLDHVHRGEHPTGSYTAVLDADGELLLAVADMSATDNLRPEHLQSARELIAHAALLVLDGNLPAATTAHLLDLAHSADLRVVLDPVSVPKAARLTPLLSPERPIFALTPNLDELRALTSEDTRAQDTAETEASLSRAAAVLHDRGVRHVWIRLGADGSLLSTRTPGQGAATLHRLAADPAEVQDVTGAGDAMLAAFAYALLAGHAPADAARHGHAAAALTLESTHTVRPDLTERLLAQALRRSPAPAPTAEESTEAR
ncbi:winged helix-turn-helix transcriptional regulator [Actinospica durhamensis]|uniref:Winged helix-turn-helix transcriptional regulator n=1 Tax=Actinospica durhamensis TaxID=1508375 RepID=A0A941ERJ3_9ACTN|nr:carbohydrate kinase [Actinospica durhamensis]MBR7836041.1 winged helix-turn-helix transcriptional regulator [Actinospica durhamensis]